MSDTDLWVKLAAPLPTTAISWRQDGRPTQRDGKYVARFVCYTDAQTVRERLDDAAPGEWSLTLDLLPSMADEDGVVGGLVAFKARLTVCGVSREDVGQGKDYKSASTDAFKRASVRFGIGHELYDMEQIWVQVDGDGKYAKPLEDPAVVYARKASGVKSAQAQVSDGNGAGVALQPNPSPVARQQPAPAPEPELTTGDGPLATDEPSCPKCGGKLWDNRLSKRNPKAPDWKCRNRSCDGCIWPEKPKARPAPAPDDDAPPPDDSQAYDEPIPF